jgi:hypothetical protein
MEFTTNQSTTLLQSRQHTHSALVLISDGNKIQQIFTSVSFIMLSRSGIDERRINAPSCPGIVGAVFHPNRKRGL